MNDSYYTDTGERPELAAIEVNLPEGYIASRIAPTNPVVDKSGTAFYATVTSDTSAQTGRAAGAAPTGTQIADSSTTFTCVENVMRGMITPDEAKQMGGIANADRVGSSWAKRQVQNAIETEVAGAILGQAGDATYAAATFISQVQAGLDAIRQYPGRRAIVGGTTALKKIILSTATQSWGSMMTNTVTGTSPEVAAGGLPFARWLENLAMLLGVDEVIAGDAAIWDTGTPGASTTANKIGIVPLADGDPLSHKWQPVWGKTFLFLPDGVQPYVIQAVADRVNVNNLYDCYAWFDFIELNSGAVYCIDEIT